jgi:hypothetical protein
LGEVRRQRRALDERDVDAGVPEAANLIGVGDVTSPSTWSIVQILTSLDDSGVVEAGY